MHGFRRTLFLSHLGLVALTLLLLALALRGLVTNFLSAQMHDHLLYHAAAPARNQIKNVMDADGFLEGRAASFRVKRRLVESDMRRLSRRNNVRLQVITIKGATIFDSDIAPRMSTHGADEEATNTRKRNRRGRDAPRNTAAEDSSISDAKAATDFGASDGAALSATANERENPPEFNEVTLALQGETNDRVRGSLRGEPPTMFLATPIRRNGDIVGVVRASSKILLLTPNVVGFAQRLAFIMAGIFVLAIGLSVALSQRLARPARRLEEATRRLAAGDLTSRAPMHKRLLGRGDEMDTLTREFNAMAEKIEAVDEERRAFLADVSHELRTPLCAIKGSAETLRDGAWRDEKAAPRFAGTIVSQSDRLIRLVGDLLRLARLEAAVSDSSHHERRMSSHVAARGLCESVCQAVAGLFDERQVRLQTECEDISIQGDADLLEGLLINLLANAARHSPPESTTTLTIARRPDGVLLQVQDEGRGIEPEHLPNLGKRFYRVEEGRSRLEGESSGSGLGLAICRRIALAHGSQLEIESEIGRGTRVWVLLAQAREKASRRK